MSLTITDYLDAFSAAGSHIPMPRGLITATPSAIPIFLKNASGGWDSIENPQPTAISDSTGKWSLVLPWPSETTLQGGGAITWQITMPDGTVWAGTPPEGIAGPLTIYTLRTSYSWTLISGPAATTSAAGALVGASTTVAPAAGGAGALPATPKG
jgi:hypothetical protein